MQLEFHGRILSRRSHVRLSRGVAFQEIPSFVLIGPQKRQSIIYCSFSSQPSRRFLESRSKISFSEAKRLCVHDFMYETNRQNKVRSNLQTFRFPFWQIRQVNLIARFGYGIHPRHIWGPSKSKWQRPKCRKMRRHSNFMHRYKQQFQLNQGQAKAKAIYEWRW